MARFLWASYQRDRADFVDLLPTDYTVAFDSDFTKKLGLVDKLVRAAVQQAKGMVFTAQIQEAYDELPVLLNRLEARARRAEGLTVPVKKLGIGAAREARNQQDKEDLMGDLKTLLQNMAENKQVLEARGQKAGDTQKIQAVYEALVTNSTGQGTNTSTQRQLTQANMGMLNELEQLMQQLFEDGKSLYERVDAARLKDYTYKKLLALVRKTKAAEEEAA